MTNSEPGGLPQEGAERAFKQAMDLWVTPEIERRRATGVLPDTFSLYRAQIIFMVDGPPEVRLNEEVSARLHVRVNRAIEKGEAVSTSDIDEIVGVDLTDQDPNAAHVTMIRHRDGWVFTYDARYNAARIETVLATAREFLDCAGFALEGNRLRAFADNLYSATELLAKARLLTLPDPKLLVPRRGHRHLTISFNRWGTLGNTDPRFVSLLNKLIPLRQAARYPPKEFSLSLGEAKRLLSLAEEMFETVRREVPRPRAKPGI